MTEQVGRFTLNGTERQNATIRAMAQKASDVYGDRLKPSIDVYFRPGAQMPKRADGGPSVGFTPSYTRIDMWAAVGRYPVEATFAHEVGHAVPMSKAGKARVVALATPAGGKWNAPGYADDVRETGARCQSRALLGVVNPPYKSFYSHDIAASKDAQLGAAYLDTPDTVEPDPTPPQPTPADPVALQAAIDRLEAEAALLNNEITSMQLTIVNARTFRDQAIETLAKVAP